MIKKTRPGRDVCIYVCKQWPADGDIEAGNEEARESDKVSSAHATLRSMDGRFTPLLLLLLSCLVTAAVCLHPASPPPRETRCPCPSFPEYLLGQSAIGKASEGSFEGKATAFAKIGHPSWRIERVNGCYDSASPNQSSIAWGKDPAIGWLRPPSLFSALFRSSPTTYLRLGT
ncbi:hypothetical protein LX36DRAFT_220537 [Colletotrichum falcatum]|nr:hypothetical protein LX36DRAFT_220537 [Colletotrichum falcatum]